MYEVSSRLIWKNILNNFHFLIYIKIANNITAKSFIYFCLHYEVCMAGSLSQEKDEVL